MKIIISEKEFYEIDMPAQISINQISVIADKLYKLNKIFGKDIIVGAIKQKEPKMPYKTRHKAVKISKEETIKLLKIYYSTLPKAEKMSALSKEGWADYNYFGKKIHYFKKKYKIQPNEVGLAEFPTSGAGQTINRQ